MNRLQILSQQINSTIPTFQKIILSICPQNKIGTIILNSPKDLNNLGEKMIDQIVAGLAFLQKSPDVYAIIIKSSHPKIFCAGADIKRFMKQDYEFYIRNQIFHILQNGFKSTKKPIVSAVNGKALGGGFELALLCDIIIGSEKAYFGLPQVNLGLMPGIGGTQRLTKLIGQKLAMRHILTGQGIDGKKAKQMNICELVNTEEFDQNVINIVKKITQKALSTLMIAKRAVKFATDSTLTQGLQFEKSTFYPMLATRAAKQGISAFIEKRKANFKGM